MTVRSKDYLKAKFETGDVPTGLDFSDLIDSFYDPSNFPNPLPAVSGENLYNISSIYASSNGTEFVPLVQVPTYSNSVTFFIPSDLTSVFVKFKRLKLQLTGLQQVVSVESSTYDSIGGYTVVVVDVAMSNPGLSKVWVSILSPAAQGGAVNQQMVGFTRGANLTAASTLSLGADSSFDVDGTTAITALSYRQEGSRITLKFNNNVTVTHSASLLLLGGVTNVYKAGTISVFERIYTGWREVSRTINKFISALQTIVAGDHLYQLAHGGASIPDAFEAYAVCTSSYQGYVTGERFRLPGWPNGGTWGNVLRADATNISLYQRNNLYILNLSNTSFEIADSAHFSLLLTATWV